MARRGKIPPLALLALAGLLLLSVAVGQPAQRPETAELDAGDHSIEEEGDDLLKGIIDHPDDLEDLGGDDDDSPHIDDFDVDGDGDEGVGMEHFEDHTGMMSDEEQKQWKEDEERFFNDADHSKDGYLDQHEYVRAMMKEMDPHQGHDPDEYQGEEPIPPSNSAVASGTGPLSTEGMTDDEKMHFEELGHQFKEEDLDKDGKISLEEWMNIMFHDAPQEPEFEEGMENMEAGGYMPHHELTPEERVEMMEDAKQEFNNTDTNGDGKLTHDEMLSFVKGPGITEPEDEDHDPISPEELEEMARELFRELDRDKNDEVSFEEFFKAHYEEPPVPLDYHEMHPEDHHLDVESHEDLQAEEAAESMGALDDTVANQ